MRLFFSIIFLSYNSFLNSIIQNQSRLWSIESASRRLSPELWRQVALFLPRRDLKTLMQIPHVLSRIAFELVFQRVDLHIGICKLAGEERIYSSPASSSPASSAGGGGGASGSAGSGGSGWHFQHDHPDRPGYKLEMQLAQRTADIMSRIVLDPQFAKLIRTVRISAERHDRSQHMAFRSNMLATAIPKLTSLKEVIFTGSNDVWAKLADVISQTHPRLESLIIEPEHDSEPVLPHLTHLTSFKCVRDHSTHSLARFLQQNRSTLRKLCLCAYYAAFPPPPAVAFANLTHLEFVGTVPPAAPGADVLQHIFTAAHQLESLRLSLVLLAPVSEAFERNLDALPRLRNFGFRALEGGGGFSYGPGASGAGAGGGQAADPGLFPAIAEFLRAHPDLVRLELEACGGEAAQKAYGYDASVLGVLPTLTKLRQLAVTVTKDVSPGLFSWILPRGLMALLLSGIPPRRSGSGMGSMSGGGSGVENFLGMMKSGMPPGLRYLAILGPIYSSPSAGGGPMSMGPAGYDEVTMLQFVKSVVPRSVRLINVGERFFTVRRRSVASPGHAHSSTSPSVHGSSPGPSSAGMSPRDTRDSRESRDSKEPRESLGREGVVEGLEEWPERRVLLHAEEWLEALGCEDALWDDFAPESYSVGGFGHRYGHGAF